MQTFGRQKIVQTSRQTNKDVERQIHRQVATYVAMQAVRNVDRQAFLRVEWQTDKYEGMQINNNK